MDSENIEKIGNLCADLRAQILSHERPGPLLPKLLLMAESIREIMVWIGNREEEEIERNERLD